MLTLNTTYSRQKGATLVEMMVGLVIALVVLVAAGSAFMLSMRSSADLLHANRLNHTLQTSIDLITSELRRAGYWNSSAPSAPTINPFSTITVNGECVLFSYDRFDSTGNPTPDGLLQNTEHSGFKRAGSIVQIKTSGTNSTDCNDGNWEALTDANTVTVSGLTFTLTARCLNSSSSPASVQNSVCSSAFTTAATGTELTEQRALTVTITASTDSNTDGTTDATKTVTSRAEVRNNQLFIKP